MNFTQDHYVEGFKKGDVKVIVDGEHYHAACPNRMDAPATRLNLIDIESVELTKSSGLLNSGIYGKVEYRRAELDNPFKLKSFVNGNFGSSQDYDASLAAEAFYTNLTFRYSSGKPYENGKGKTFNEIYGYKDNLRYSYMNG